MSFSKLKTITVTADDFLDQGVLYHAEFIDKNGSPCLIQVLPDYDSESPRECDNLWTWTTTANAGYSDIKPEYHNEARKGYCQKYYYRPDDFHGDNGLDEEFKKENIIVPLFLCRHSGDVISAGDYGTAWSDKLWDAGCMGFAFVSRNKIMKEFNCKRITKKIKNRAIDCLKNEIKAMNAANFGEVYGIKIINLETEEQDSCWGFNCPDWIDVESYVSEMLYGWVDDDQLQNVIKGLQP